MGSCHGEDESKPKKAEGGLEKADNLRVEESCHGSRGAGCCGGSGGNWLSFIAFVLLLIIALKLFKVL